MRLRNAVEEYTFENGRLPDFLEMGNVVQEKVKDEEFYTNGSQELKDARLRLAKFSIPMA